MHNAFCTESDTFISLNIIITLFYYFYPAFIHFYEIFLFNNPRDYEHTYKRARERKNKEEMGWNINNKHKFEFLLARDGLIVNCEFRDF